MILLLFFVDIQFGSSKWWGESLAASGLALVLLSRILRENLSLVLVAGFGTVIVSTLGAPLLTEPARSGNEKRLNAADRKAGLPVYVHIILDEHLGVEGFDDAIPSQKAIKTEIKSLFSSYNFRTFGRAYSPYYWSGNSIASMLNLEVPANTKHLYDESTLPHVLLKNKYFDIISSKGYGINIYQSTFMDFCPSAGNNIQKCVTYDYDGISNGAVRELTSKEKAGVILSLYMGLSHLRNASRELYKALRPFLAALRVNLPDWPDGDQKVGPIPVLPIFDRLIADVSSSPGGTMFFAHLLIPHFPYSVDSECRIRRPVLFWNNHRAGITDSDQAKSERSRLARYEEYIPQIRCAHSKLKQLLEAMKARGTFRDSVIIVHGDHGSRIGMVEPRIKNKTRLASQDYRDAYSTLYAVKSPNVAPGYSTRMIALPDLVRDTVSGTFIKSENSEPDARPAVYLRDLDNPHLEKHPMPPIPITRR